MLLQLAGIRSLGAVPTHQDAALNLAVKRADLRVRQGAIPSCHRHRAVGSVAHGPKSHWRLPEHPYVFLTHASGNVYLFFP